MSLSITDMQGAAHGVMMDAQKLVEEIARELLQPLIEMEQARTVEMVIGMFEQMPPEMKATMEKQNPDKFAAMMQAVDQLKKRGKNG